MSESITGILEQLNPRPTTKGTAYDMIIGGKQISTFRPGNIKVGDNLKVDYIERNGFLNAANIESVPLDPTKDQKQTVLPAFPGVKNKPSDATIGMVIKETARAFGKSGQKDEMVKFAKMLLELDQILKTE